MARTQEKVIKSAMSGGINPRSAEAAVLELINKITMRLAYLSMSKAGLAIGSGSKAKILIANTINFIIDGKFVALTTAEYVIGAAAAMANSAGAKEVWIALSSVDGVNVVLTYGDVALLGATAVKPTVPDNAALIGWVKIAAAANTAFVPGTTDLDAAGITDTYEDAAFDPRELLELVAVQ